LRSRGSAGTGYLLSSHWESWASLKGSQSIKDAAGKMFSHGLVLQQFWENGTFIKGWKIARLLFMEYGRILTNPG
jgi:hypothetical protein